MSDTVLRPRFRAQRRLAIACTCAALTVWGLRGQAEAAAQSAAPVEQSVAEATLPAFDVVSIKTHKDEAMGMARIGISTTPDGFQADGVPLQMLVRQALGLSEDRIVNEPDWTGSARFDINAKVAPEDASKLKALSMRQRSDMLLPVLEDRFGLKYHHETRELQVYTLVVAKGGPKLKESTPAESGAGPSPPPPLLPPGASSAPGGAASLPPGGGPPGGPRTLMHMSTQGMMLDARGSSMTSLSQIISQQIGATVVDKTGLTAKYDFTLSFMPDSVGMSPMMRPPSGGPPPDGAQTQEPVGPSLFTAVQEQLGLKLVAEKEPTDVVVIDHIEQPSAN
ncbi:MAG: TIGR03435 family protein [Terracidiphilus sp.]